MAEVAIARNFFWLLLFWLGTHHLDSAVKPEQCMALHASAAASAAFFVVPEAKTVLVLKAKKKKKVTVPSRTALVGVAWQSETECARGFRREQHWKTQVVQHCSKVRQRRLGQCRWKLLHLQRCKDDCRFDKGGRKSEEAQGSQLSESWIPWCFWVFTSSSTNVCSCHGSRGAWKLRGVSSSDGSEKNNSESEQIR